MKIGIFSGSFNPIHIGHLILADYITEFTDVDEIWFSVTPHNPLKDTSELLDENIRYEMVSKALEPYSKFKVSNFEFTLPRPSYTINTLEALSENYPEHEFSLILGADNWDNFHQWKDYKTILDKFHIYVYPRLGYTLSISKALRGKVEGLESPIIEISSTFVRNSIAEGKFLKAFLPDAVYTYIKEKDLYRKDDQ